MAILKVARMGHPVLRTPARPLAPSDIPTAPVQRLIDDMLETMREYSGIGLAAPQVHHSVRILVAGLRPGDASGPMSDDAEMPLVVLINPEVVLVGDVREEGWEGCLSIPDVRGRVPRSREVRVTAYDRTGRRVEIEASGLPARVLLHEQDHLDGILFVDRMTSFESLTFMDEYQRFHAKSEDEDD